MDSQGITMIITACVGSTGLFSVISLLLQRAFSNRDKKEDLVNQLEQLDRIKTQLGLLDVQSEALRVILHDRIFYLCPKYIMQGYIHVDDLNNLELLYNSYARLHGNGTAKILYDKCKELKVINEENQEIAI